MKSEAGLNLASIPHLERMAVALAVASFLVLSACQLRPARLVDLSDERGWTPLTLAANRGDVEAVRSLLKEGADPNGRNREGLTPLILGAKVPQMVSDLLDAGATVDAAMPNGVTPLMAASTESAAILLSKGASVNARDGVGHTALSGAAAVGDVERVNLLLAHGAVVNQQDFVFGKSPLMYAAGNGHAPMVERLLAVGADPNTRSADGWTALGFAALGVRSAPLTVLLRSQVDLDTVTMDGRTALIIAARESRTENVKLLLEAGANPNVRDRDGRTALGWAVSRGDNATRDVLAIHGAVQ